MSEFEILQIKEVLKSKGITSKKLAELVGSHPVYISEILNGKKLPSLDLLMKIADSIGVDIRTLFKSTGDDLSTRELYVKNDDGTFSIIGNLIDEK